MQLNKARSKQAILAALILATGIPASLSQAQFRVGYSDKTASSQKDETAKGTRTFVFKGDDDGHSYEVKIVNGTVELAEIDGKRIANDRVRTSEERVIFLSEDGKALYEFKAPSMTRSVWTSQGNDAQNQFVIEARTEQPKVMLGINLSEPGNAMRKQLKLGDDQKVILVERVIPGLPAHKAGLEDFDVIISIDGSDQASGELLTEVMRGKRPGDELKLVVLRAGEKKKIGAKLDAYDPKRLGITSIEHNRPMIFPDTPRVPAVPGVYRLGFSGTLGAELKETIIDALKNSGLEEDEIERALRQVEQHMRPFYEIFDQDSQGGIKLRSDFNERFEEHQHRLMEEARTAVENTREKARQAMRDAERQMLQLRDGRLVVRSADREQDELEKLESRLDTLESRMEAQMSRFESQMSRIAGMLDRLLDRLEADDE